LGCVGPAPSEGPDRRGGRGRHCSRDLGGNRQTAHLNFIGDPRGCAVRVTVAVVHHLSEKAIKLIERGP
jgi:hypothetical protein